MTQLHGDANDLDHPWYAGRLHAVPEPEPEAEDDDEPWPAAAGHRDPKGRWDPDGLGPPASSPGEPLFEQLRSAYLHADDTHDWARDRDVDTVGWAADDSDRWAAVGAAGVEDHDGRDRWVDAPSAWQPDTEAGWDDPADALGDLDEEDELDLEPEPPAAPARGGRRRRTSPGRVGLRRTSTLLNAVTILLFVVGALAAAGLTGWILSARLLTTRQLFFLTHSTLGILIVHAFGGGLGTLLTSGDSRTKDRIRKLSTAGLAVVAWLASAVGTWFGYAGYRAKVPPGGDIAMYPREYLLSSPQLAFWETFAMEWKVHIGWTTPFLATAVAFTALRYRRRLVADRLVRKVMTIMLLLAFAGALVAAGLGAVVNVTAPNDFMHRGWSP